MSLLTSMLSYACRTPDANTAWESRSFYRRRFQLPDGSWEEGTFGSVAFNRAIMAFDHMGTDIDPFESQEERAKMEEAAKGECVGFLPDIVEQQMATLRRGHAEYVNQQVIHVAIACCLTITLP